MHVHGMCTACALHVHVHISCPARCLLRAPLHYRYITVTLPLHYRCLLRARWALAVAVGEPIVDALTAEGVATLDDDCVLLVLLAAKHAP